MIRSVGKDHSKFIIISTVHRSNCCYLNENPRFRFCQNAMFLHKVRVNGINWTEGKQNLFELARCSS